MPNDATRWVNNGWKPLRREGILVRHACLFVWLFLRRSATREDYAHARSLCFIPSAR